MSLSESPLVPPFCPCTFRQPNGAWLLTAKVIRTIQTPTRPTPCTNGPVNVPATVGWRYGSGELSSRLVFWLVFCSCLLLAIGRRELTTSSQYESLSMDHYEDHFQRCQGEGLMGNMLTPSPGDYATVPDIRSEPDDASVGSSSTSEKARIVTIV